MAAFVEYTSDAAEALLASGVPDLKLHDVLVIDAHNVVAELDADGDVMLVVKCIFDQSRENARLADPCVPNDDHLEERIVVDLLVLVDLYQLVAQCINFFLGLWLHLL